MAWMRPTCLFEKIGLSILTLRISAAIVTVVNRPHTLHHSQGVLKMATKEKTAEVFPDLRNRIVGYFRTQPENQPSDQHGLFLDLKGDLKKLVPEEAARERVKEMEEKKMSLPEKAAEKVDAGREQIALDVVERLKTEGILKGIKLEKGGLGLFYSGKRPDHDWPEGQTPKEITLRIDQVRVDKGIQQRENGVDERVVANYAAVHSRLPRIRVFHEKKDGKDFYVMSRGFHRIAAKKLAGQDMIDCEVFEGDRQAAILDAIGDNATHGFARSEKDIRKSVGTLLGLRGWKNASTNAIAEKANCSWATADKYRRAWERENQVERGSKVTGSDGVERPAAQAQTAPVDPVKADPNATPPKEAAPEAAEVPAVAPKDYGLDKMGGKITDEGVAKAFRDNRLKLAVDAIEANLRFIVELQADGYAFSALPVKAREETAAEIRHWLETYTLSVPFSVLPEKPGKKFQAAARRGWMTQAEWSEWNKSKGKPEADGEAAATAAPAEGTSQTEKSVDVKSRAEAAPAAGANA